MKRWAKRGAVGFAAIIISASTGCWFLLRASLPQTSGTLTLRGLEKPVRVVRDPYGVPTIEAATRHDLYMGLGFVHAQDRLFQMDLQRRAGAGRLSEILGDAPLNTDRLMRTLGLYRHAAASLASASPEFRRVLDAYAAGINAFLHSGNTLPIEYTLLGYRPEDWRPADSLVIGKLLALQLSGNYRQELLRARLAQTLTPAEITDLFPEYPKDAPVTLTTLAALTRGLPLDAMLGALPKDVAPERASNNWVVDGAHSVTGKPLLANDPHLDFAAPVVWYLTRLEAPDVDVAGATTPGAPVVVLGHNDCIAWGYTTTNADVEDLFVERIDAEDSTRYATPAGPASFEVRDEKILIKGRTPEALTVRTTRHGPVISDIVGDQASAPHTALALQASFLNDDDQSVEAQWRVNLAQDWSSWRDALRLITGPPQNMVFADREGNIGFTVPGRIPIRKAGDGRAPVPGQHGEFDWSGYIPFENLPQAFNPAIGHIATANNKIVPDGFPYLITMDWDTPYRIERIEAGLAETPKQSLASSASLQGELVSLSARQLVPMLLSAEPRDARAATAIDLLRRWDARMDAGRPEPLIYAAWLRVLNERLFTPRLGTLYGRYWSASPLVTQNVLQGKRAWCGAAGCPALLQESLDKALDDLAGRYGGTMDAWQWGQAHQATFEHLAFGHVPVLGALFARHMPAGGSADTINAGGYRPSSADQPFADIHGPGLRALNDMSNRDNSVFQIALGQSAHVLSPHYDDLQALWGRLEGVRMPHDPKGETLTLIPAAPN